MKKVIVYYSFSGNNEALAKKLSSLTGAVLEKISELKKRSGITILWDLLFKRTPRIQTPQLDLSSYDHVILVAPIWAGKIATPLKTFIKQEKNHIKQYSYISLCGNGGNHHVGQELNRLANKTPTSVTELKVNDLLPTDQKNRVKYTSGYRIKDEDFQIFQKEIDDFLQQVEKSER